MKLGRLGALFAGLLIAGCGVAAAPDLPDPATPLGKILRIANFAESAAALKRYTETRLGQSDALKAEFLAAGFVAETVRDDKGVECQGYRRKSRNVFPVVVLVNICGREVSTNAGQIAP